MDDANNISISGRLTSDPISRKTNTGSTALNFNLQTVQEFKNQTTTKRNVIYTDCVAYGQTADNSSEFMSKGSWVLVVGKITNEAYVSKQTGENRTKHKINVDKITHLDYIKPRQEPQENAFEEDGIPY